MNKEAVIKILENGGSLAGANLRVTSLVGANLIGAALFGANLTGAAFNGTSVRSAIIGDTTIGLHPLSCPKVGEFEAWKKCRNGVLVRLLIPADAKRSSALSSKCRASHAKVLEVIGAEVGVSFHDKTTTYKMGDTVHCHKWCDDRWTECGGGIHFFMNRIEAENYNYM